ncbi:MAG: efflux RND transporter periplasmic adaptor subunit [Anaerolineae bacterium]|nr:efflux RND transporter periplasmic adaptor subunit [Gloeobacterales cyanobacterium ES-bin-313]
MVCAKHTGAKFLYFCLAMGLLSSCGSGSEPSASAGAPPAIPVKVITAQTSQVEQASEYIGTLKSRRSVTLQPQVAGQISKIFVPSGATVSEGTPLMQIDPSKQQATVRSSQSSALSSQARLESARALLKTYQAQRSANLATLAYNKQRFQRFADLRKDGAIGQQDLDNYKIAFDTAQATLESSNAQIQVQKAAIAEAQATLSQSQAGVNEQQVQLQYFSIAAPFTGQVGDIPVKVGDFVSTETKLASVTQNRPIEVYVSVPIERAPELRNGTPVQLLDSEGKLLGTSSVFFIAPAATDTTQSVLIKAVYENARGQLRADQLVRARVIWKRQPGVFVPTSAVSHLGGQDFIFVAETKDGKTVARQRPAKLGDIIGSNYVVLQGLKPGEKLITTGIQILGDGAPVAPES